MSLEYPLVATQEGVFAYMQEEFGRREEFDRLSPYIRHNFVQLRKHAEELARFHYKHDNARSLTLEDIYIALGMTGEVDAKEARRMIALEREAWKKLWPSGFNGQGETGSAEGLLPVERFLVERHPDDLAVQLLAGASSRARREHNLVGPATIGASLGGPVLMPYVEWILQRTLAMGFRRLYFIARDGFILKQMANILIERLELEVETYYIRGSRRAWRMPSYRGRKGELRNLVGWSHAQHIRSVEDLADVLGMPSEELREWLPAEYRGEGRQFTFGELSLCTYLLDTNDAFRHKLRESLAGQRSLVQAYLKQEIDISDDNFAFVELAGGGFTQICLARLMEDFYSGQVRTFFYKMDSVRKPDGECVFFDFFPSKLRNDLIIEMVCRAPEGQTEGYVFEGGRIVPRQKLGEADQYLQCGYDEYVKGVEAFARAYAEAKEVCHTEPSLKTPLACVDYIYEKKQEDNDIVKFFAALPNSVTGREVRVPDFAPPLTKQQVREIMVTYTPGNVWSSYQGTDFDLSVKRSEPHIRKLVAKYKKYGQELRTRWLRLFPPKKYNMAMDAEGLGILPYSLLGFKNVVIYGAGKKGRQLYDAIQGGKTLQVVQWLDQDFLRLRKQLPLSGDINELGHVQFDAVIIAMGINGPWQLVKTELVNRGISEGAIIDPENMERIKKIWLNGMKTYLHI